MEEDKKDFYALLKNAFDYYDDCIVENTPLYDTVKSTYINITPHETELDKIELYADKDYKELIKSYKYEIIGCHYIDSNIWVWGWGIPHIGKKATQTSRKLLNYGLNMNQKNVGTKAELITSRTMVTDNVQVSMYIALSVYLSKKRKFIDLNGTENDKWYVFLLD